MVRIEPSDRHRIYKLLTTINTISAVDKHFVSDEFVLEFLGCPISFMFTLHDRSST